ncbi:acyltransferase [Microbacterium sp. 4R-513]|nr:acyltransferase [Microbacterium sp. 4R-513]
MLLYHVLALNWASLQNGVYLEPAANVWANVLIFSPAHIVWLGAEAVWFFFVLSGFVLTKAAARPDFYLPSYYPSRLVRLYGPVLLAIVLAWLTYTLVPHVVEPGDPPAIAGLPAGYPLGDILRDATLLGGTSTSIGVLWSLQWEVLFSLALPVYLLLVRKYPKSATAVAVVSCLVGWANADQVLSFMPMFFFGALLAQYWERVCRAFSFLRNGRLSSHAWGAVLVALAACGLTSYFLLGRWLGSVGAPARVVTLPLVMAAIMLLIIVSVNWPPLSRLLSTRGLVFLGTISFSLYLVHRPIMIMVAFLAGIGPMPAILAIVASVGVAIGFYYVAERPVHRLSRRIERSVRASAATPQPRGDSTAAEAARADTLPG